MIVQPLFGRDSSPIKTSHILSLIITTVLTLIFTVASVFIKFPEQKKYKTIQINLNNTVEKTQEKIPEAAETVPAEETVVSPESFETAADSAESASVELLPVVEAAVVEAPVKTTVEEPLVQPPVTKTEPPVTKTEPPVKKDVAKKNPVKSDSSPVIEPVTPLYELQASNEDLYNSQLNYKRNDTASNFDWNSMFDDSTTVSSSDSTSFKGKVTGESSFSGSQGMIEQKTKKNTENVSESNPKISGSVDTDEQLKNLQNAKTKQYSPQRSSTNNSYAEFNASNSTDGTVVFQMDNGKRSLIEPLTAAIPISDEAGRTIDSKREVTINFSVDKNGNVPSSEIYITPKSALTNEIIEEIKATMSKWRFDSADYASKASFKFTIEKK